MDEIFRRGTCRYFKKLTPVPDDQLLTLVKAGMQARAVGNQKSRDFIIVTREDLVTSLSYNSIIAGPSRRASAVIVIVGKKDGISFPDEWTFDCAAAAQNILIEAEHLGLATLWMQVYPYQDRKIKINHLLDLPDDGVEAFCMIAVGYAERRPVRINRFDERAISYDLYGKHTQAQEVLKRDPRTDWGES